MMIIFKEALKGEKSLAVMLIHSKCIHPLLKIFTHHPGLDIRPHTKYGREYELRESKTCFRPGAVAYA